jgi:hypothetical protein
VKVKPEAVGWRSFMCKVKLQQTVHSVEPLAVQFTGIGSLLSSALHQFQYQVHICLEMKLGANTRPVWTFKKGPTTGTKVVWLRAPYNSSLIHYRREEYLSEGE